MMGGDGMECIDKDGIQPSIPVSWLLNKIYDAPDDIRIAAWRILNAWKEEHK